MPKKLTSPMKYQHFAVVYARNKAHSFPIDMLRYDRCYPYTETDSAKILLSIGSYAVPGKHIPSVVVTKFSEHMYPEWNYNRWESFGWRLEEVTRDQLSGD